MTPQPEANSRPIAADPTPPTSSVPAAMEKQYVPAQHEPAIHQRWSAARAFHADPATVLRGERRPYAIVIPPPNVTDRLHVGHALNNTLQDILARAHRMMGRETLWMPGTDHAGIATQTVVEKRVLRDEGKRRTEFTREQFVAKIQAFKDEYEATITSQLRALGCSCDWERQRFTMDPVCAWAVMEAFYRLFEDGLIYRGKRLVNWDPITQTALADDEVEMEEIDGSFYYLRYPLGAPDSHGRWTPITWNDLAARGYPAAALAKDGALQAAGDPAWVTVATTRPETYLGDTAVALNPADPRAAALRGLHVRLPLVNRVIPIVEDDYVVLPAADPDAPGVDPKAKYATGFLKVTPAHDFNDYDLGARHGLGVINVMAPDASISDKHGWTDIGDARLFVGMPRELARREVVNQFRRSGLLAEVRPYRHGVGHSYRSHAPVEPYFTDQWYVKVTSDALAGAALRALAPEQAEAAPPAGDTAPAPADGGLRLHPARYAKTYQAWHQNIRDWCISRQLWWGHRIPVWTLIPDVASIKKGEILEDSPYVEAQFLGRVESALVAYLEAAGVAADVCLRRQTATQWYLCARNDRAAAALAGLEHAVAARTMGEPHPEAALPAECQPAALQMLSAVTFLERDEDVLDTWFSSALWPLSTMGWPESTDLLAAFNPTDALCTAREIITLWVSRMVMFNRYFLGEDRHLGHGRGPLPFKDVFVHAIVMDEQGRKMSKSLGNGVDPLDIIATHGTDALRYTLCHMTTQTQDVRMPVVKDAATGRNTSPKFDLGRNFCNKLWNASRYAVAVLAALPSPGPSAPPADPAALSPVDRWMLSRLESTLRRVDHALASFEFSVYAHEVYDLLWRDFCDWYLEAIKPTVMADPGQQAVLRTAADVILRLLHPVVPFVTESIHQHLADLPVRPVAGVRLETAPLLCRSAWPAIDASLADPEAESSFESLRSLVTVVREARARQNVSPKRRILLHVPPDLAARLQPQRVLIETLAGLEAITADAPAAGEPAVAVPFGAVELKLTKLADAVDAGAERERLARLSADLAKSIAALEGRLNNPGYAQRAPAKLVEETKGQLAQKQAELEAVRASLQRLAT